MIKTNEQDVVAAKKEMAVLKEIYKEALKNYIFHESSDLQASFRAILDCQQSGANYFNFVEEFVGNSSLLGAHASPLWVQGFAEDCGEILKSMPSHFQLLHDGFLKFDDFPSDKIKPSGTAYANMQRMTVKHLKPIESSGIKRMFEDAGLPVYGFKNEARDVMSKKLQIILTFSFGVSFVILLIIIAFIKPDPSTFQHTIFRTVLAIAGAATAAVFPGFIEVKLGSWLRAGGALAVFVVLYFWIPAMAK